MQFSVKSPAAKLLGRFFLVFSTLIGSSLFVLAQTGPQTNPKRVPETSSTAPATQSANSASRASADETFELNITERRYSQENFAASTAVGTSGGDQKLNVNIGVALSAGRIDALLRNVHGTVRFRGSLGRIFEIVGDRLTPPPAVAPAPSP